MVSFDLQAVLLLQSLVLLPEGVDTVNHGLDQLNLRVSQPVLVGHVVGAAVKATGLSAGSTGLDSKLLTPLLEGVKTLLDVAVLLGQGEVLAALSLDGVPDGLDATGKTGEDALDVATLLHGDDPHLVLLVHPQQEGLGLVVEDATALGPVTLHTGGNEVAVSRHEEEVVVNELLADLLVHSGQGVVGAGKVA